MEQRILDLVDTHPTLPAIGHGEPVSDLALIELERALHRDLGGPGLEFSEENIRKAYGIKSAACWSFCAGCWSWMGCLTTAISCSASSATMSPRTRSTPTRFAFCEPRRTSSCKSAARSRPTSTIRR